MIALKKVWLSTLQRKYRINSGFTCRVFGLKENSIQIIAGDVGGGFEANFLWTRNTCPYLEALFWINPSDGMSQDQNGFKQDLERDYTAKVKGAFDKSGQLKALETDIIADMGCDGAEKSLRIRNAFERWYFCIRTLCM